MISTLLRILALIAAIASGILSLIAESYRCRVSTVLKLLPVLLHQCCSLAEAPQWKPCFLAAPSLLPYFVPG